MFGFAAPTRMDGKGRIAIAPWMRDEGPVRRRALLVGMGHYFEVWDLDQVIAEGPADVKALAAAISLQPPRPTPTPRTTTMTLLCNLAGHAPAPVDLENQGFAFSRCRRCGDDLIRSAAAPAARWTVVPEGFRVAWRAADMTGFEYISDAQLLLERAARTVATVRDVAKLVTAIYGWWVTDNARRAKLALVDAGRSSRRMLRLPTRKPAGRRLVVTVQLTMARSPQPE